MDISIVVPVFNESQSLGELFEQIKATLDKSKWSWEVIFVDDGSSDGSFETAAGLHQGHPDRVQVIRFSRNYGKSAALSVGIERAGGDMIVTMDADLQDDPAAIPDLISHLEKGSDLVSGWKKVRHDPLSKTLPSKVWNIMTSWIAGVRLHDFNCGFKAYRAEVAKSLEIYGERHRYLPVLAHWNGYRITEAVVPHHARKYGRSKYGMKRMVNGFLDLITLVFLQKYLKNPLHFFGVLGLLLFAAGGTVLGYFGVMWLVSGQMHIRPLVLLSVGALIMGIQFISIGLLGEMITHSSARNTYTIRQSLTRQ